jgi:hypothetical protein
MAKTEAAPAPINPTEWLPMKLVAAGVVTLLVALSIIIFMGSRLGGCMYLDGSHGPNDYNHGPN